MIFDALDGLNWLAVAAAAAAALAIGIVWFSPFALGTLWARQVSRYTAVAEDAIATDAGRPRALSAWLGTIAVSALALAMTAEALDTESPVEGVALGLVLAVGIGATLAGWPVIFARMPWQWWLLNAGAFLLMQIAMGAILGAWR